MNSLVIMKPSEFSDTTGVLGSLVTFLQLEHGYRVVVEEASPDASLVRLATHHMFLVCEVTAGHFYHAPQIVRIRPAISNPVGLSGLAFEFQAAPDRLALASAWLLDYCQTQLPQLPRLPRPRFWSLGHFVRYSTIRRLTNPSIHSFNNLLGHTTQYSPAASPRRILIS